jgi:hypothetical protein
MQKKKEIKLEKVQLTQQEIWDGLRVPPPFKNKKKYIRKKKHPKKDLED